MKREKGLDTKRERVSQPAKGVDAEGGLGQTEK
jgi:hypothetical protein